MKTDRPVLSIMLRAALLAAPFVFVPHTVQAQNAFAATVEQNGPQNNVQNLTDGADIGRSGAMRAPLNIVPPVMQRALGKTLAAPKASQKLAPRVAARQSKRAVRAVAAAPGSTGEIVQVGQLGALQDAPIGLQSGFGSELWRGARLAFITGQMARLPERIEMDALRAAELTLYRSTTAAPVGTVDGTSWYAARLNRFLALGDMASVLQLEALTGGAAQDAYAARAVILAHLGGGDAAAACAIAAPRRGTRGHGDTLAFFMQFLVYCQLRAGEFEKAGLTLELNEKTLGEDRFFRDLAFLMSAQAQPVFGTSAQVDAAKKADQEPPLVVPSEVTPMQLALLQLAGYGLSVPLDKLPPYFMAALAKDYAQPTATQLGAAHLAVRAGSLPSERFSQMSQLADLSAYQTAAAPAAASGAQATPLRASILSETAPPAVFLANALLTVDMATPEDQPMALADALRDAQERGLWRDMVQLLDDRLKALATILDSPPQTDDAAALPMIADSDRAVLMTAYTALDGDLMPQAFFAQPNDEAVVSGASQAASLIEATPSLLPAMARLLAYQHINDPAADPLGDLLAGLDAAGVATGDALPAQAAPTDNGLPAFSNLPQGETSAPADTRPHPIADWQAFEAQYEMASAALQRYLNRELAVYQGLGFEVPEAFRAAQSESDGDPRITKLADNKWIGDLLLGFVTQYAGMSAETMGEEDIIALLSYLRRAGLDATAQAVGAEILHHAAARLSVVAPQSLLAGNP